MRTFRSSANSRRDQILTAVACLLLGACLSIDLVANAMPAI